MKKPIKTVEKKLVLIRTRILDLTDRQLDQVAGACMTSSCSICRSYSQ
jgi:hypothetical protein